MTTLINKLYIPIILTLVLISSSNGGEPPKETGKELNIKQETTDVVDEMIIKAISNISEEKALKLKDLKKDDPEKYKREINEIARMFSEVRRGEPRRDGMERKTGMREHGQYMRKSMQKRMTEFNEWLKGNFPDEVTKLEALREKDPETFEMSVRQMRSQYWSAFEVYKKDSKLAKRLIEDVELKAKRGELVTKISKTQNKTERKRLIVELKEVIAERFDILLSKQEFRNKELTRRLEELEKELEQKKARLNDLQKNKSVHVEKRYEELTKKSSDIQWD